MRCSYFAKLEGSTKDTYLTAFGLDLASLRQDLLELLVHGIEVLSQLVASASALFQELSVVLDFRLGLNRT